MIMPKNQGIPIGSIGAGKIDFFPDLSIGNAIQSFYEGQGSRL
ncbi:MAG: hypothetical protein ACP5NY_09120 [Thermocladium sp.]